MESKNLQITKNEAEVLLSLINIAIKSSGLEGNVAKNGIYFYDKLNSLFTDKKGEVEVKKEDKKEEIIKP